MCFKSTIDLFSDVQSGMLIMHIEKLVFVPENRPLHLSYVRSICYRSMCACVRSNIVIIATIIDSLKKKKKHQRFKPTRFKRSGAPLSSVQITQYT